MNPPRSAYLHIPFCHRRCFYCDFAVVPLGDSAIGESGPGISSIKSYLDLLHREISLSNDGPPLSTVYIGGGTPSVLKPLEIRSLLAHLKNKFGFQCGAEVTIEVDPSSFSKDDLSAYIEFGINRLSIGGQSFCDSTLTSLGRSHNRKDLIEVCNWINCSYQIGDLQSWSLDLIQNLPNATVMTWKMELEDAVSTYAPHLSVYDLTIESGTVFGRKYEKGELLLPSEAIAEEINITTNLFLSDRGYSRYEISNYCLPGHASRHNRMYWSGSGWWAFGMGATSAPWGKRLARPRTIFGYKKWIEEQEEKALDPSLFSKNANPMPLDELLMIGLRKREGVDLEQLAKASGWDQESCNAYLNLLENYWKIFLDKGLLIQRTGRFYLSNPEGMEISNQILIQMMLWWESLPFHVVDQSSS